MTIFDYLADIFVHKRMNLTLEGYSPYLVNRWISFINPSISDVIAKQLNSKIVLENKEIHYKLLLSIMPKLSRCPKIQYIKKIKSEETDFDFKIKMIAENYELSTREIAKLIENSTLLEKDKF